MQMLQNFSVYRQAYTSIYPEVAVLENSVWRCCGSFWLFRREL